VELRRCARSKRNGAGGNGAFGPDSLKAAKVTDAAGIDLSNRAYDWNAVGELKNTCMMPRAERRVQAV